MIGGVKMEEQENMETTEIIRNASGVFPLKIAPGGRYFNDCNDEPFLIKADTAWMIFANITVEEAGYYLDQRRENGINTILCYAAPFRIEDSNVYGEKAFIDSDLSAPNDLYFKHVDQIIRLAAAKNMLVIMGPVEMGDYAKYYTQKNAKTLGHYFGKRYKGFGNLMWFVGGDIHPDQVQIDICDTLAKSLRKHDPDHLISFHPAGGNSSSDYFNDYPWLDFNMVQVFGPESPKHYSWMLSDYSKTPVRPTMLAEPCYEDNDDMGTPPVMNSAYQVRRAISWGFLSGGCGLFYGHKNVYKYTSKPNWKDMLSRPAFIQYSSICAFFGRREWHKLVPDVSHKLLISGFGDDGSMDRAAAGLASDGSFAIIYIPSSRFITINMNCFNSAKSIRWYDPTNNKYTIVGRYLNKGNLEFSIIQANSEGRFDRFLVIE